MQTFGASAPLKELQKKFGFEPEVVTALARDSSSAADFRRWCDERRRVAQDARLQSASGERAAATAASVGTQP